MIPDNDDGQARDLGESDKQYNAYLVYRGLGIGRTIDKTREALGLKDTRRLERWSSAHHWSERARAWTDHLSRIAATAEATAYEQRVVPPAW